MIMKVDWTKVWEFIKKNWIYFVVGVGCFILGTLV